MRTLKQKVISSIIIEVVESNQALGCLFQQFQIVRNSNLASLTLRAWKEFTRNRRTTKRIKMMKMDKSEALYDFNLKMKVFSTILKRVNRRRLLILQLLSKYLMKKHWKIKAKCFKRMKHDVRRAK